METFLSDLAFGIRTLRKSPGFAITTLVTLALGIGATTAIFSVVNAVLLRPLPYPDADRLVLITSDLRTRSVRDFPFAPADLKDLRDQTTAFSGIEGVVTFRQSVASMTGEPEQVTVGFATKDFLPLLGQKMLLGRGFNDDDAVPPPPPPKTPPAANAPPPPPQNVAVILGHDYWQRRYGGDRAIIGKTVDMGFNRGYIVGVAAPELELLFPPRFGITRVPDLFMVSRIDLATASRINVVFRLVARLKEGTSLPVAQHQVDAVASDLRKRFPDRQHRGRVLPRGANARRSRRRRQAGAAHAARRGDLRAADRLRERREPAPRAHVPARARTRGARGLRREPHPSGAADAGGGARALGRGRTAGARGRETRHPAPHLASGRRTSRTSGAWGSMAACSPSQWSRRWPRRPSSAWCRRSARRAPISSACCGRAGAPKGSRAGTCCATASVMAEVTLAFVLLVGGGLMFRSFLSLVNTDPGFDPRGVMTFVANNNRQMNEEQRAAYMRALHERLAALPGVTQSTVAFPLPLDGNINNMRWGTEAAIADPSTFKQGNVYIVIPGFFTALHTPILAGRDFTEADNNPKSQSIIINDLVAEKAFHGQPAVGKRLLARFRTDTAEWVEVIGVVKHQRHETLAAPGREALYVTDGQFGFGNANRWALRTQGDPAAIMPAVRKAIAELDPGIAVSEVLPMSGYVTKARESTTFALALIGAFAVIAVVLSGVGLYGVLSTTVRQRTAEIGVRMALGAPKMGIFTMVIGQGVKMSVAGIVVGLIASLAVTRVMRSLLVGVAPTDPLTFVAVALLFFAIAVLACWLPARRAAGLDPARALKDD